MIQSKPKVLHIAQATGGVQNHVISLLKSLDREAWDPMAIVPPIDRVKGASQAKTSFAQALDKIGVPYSLIDMKREIDPWSDAKACVAIYRIIKKENVSLVHVHSSKAGFLGRVAARWAGVPAIVYTPNSISFDRPGRSKIAKNAFILLEKLAGLCCHAIIAVSPSERSLLATHRIFAPDKIEYVPNAVDKADLLNGDVETDQVRKSLGIQPTDPLVVMVGRLAPQKAPEDFVRVAELTIKAIPEAKFLLVGDGPLHATIKDQISCKGLQDSVQLLGWREDAVQLTYCSDLAVLTSLWEGMPYCVLEAMALGKPIVATCATGTKDLLADGKGGVLTPLKDPEAMAKEVIRLLQDRDAAERMGEQGIMKIKESYSLEHQIELTETLYRKLLSIGQIEQKEPVREPFLRKVRRPRVRKIA